MPRPPQRLQGSPVFATIKPLHRKQERSAEMRATVLTSRHSPRGAEHGARPSLVRAISCRR
jgi:hypothetical protein